MEMKVFCSIFFVTFAPLVFSAGKSKSDCVTQCNYLVARFGRNALRKEFDWKQEMRIICKEKSSLSISICNSFPRHQVPKIIRLATKMPSNTTKLCQKVCPFHEVEVPGQSSFKLEKIPVNEMEKEKLMKNVVNEVKDKCEWCKQRVKSCATIAKYLRLPFNRFAGSLCPLLHADLNSNVMCRSVASEMINVPITAANKLCKATNLCNQGVEECPFRRVISDGNIFETAFSIVSIISQAVNPLVESAKSDLRSSFLVLDESVRCCDGPRYKQHRRRGNRHATSKHQCKTMCENIPALIKQNMNKKKVPNHFHRKQFKELCNKFADDKLKQRCHALHKSTDVNTILQILFGKQICQNLECQLHKRYPQYGCRLCKLSIGQLKMKKIIEVGMETLSTINEGIKLLCSSTKDQRCDQFMARQGDFHQALKSMFHRDTICSTMGFCS